MFLFSQQNFTQFKAAKSADDIGCTDRISAEGEDIYFTNDKDMTLNHCEASVILELRGMHSCISLTFIPGPVGRGVFAPDRTLYIDQIKRFVL